MQMRTAEEQTLSSLQRCSLTQLEAIYGASYGNADTVMLPEGCYRGFHLAWLNTAGARHPVTRPLEHFGFYWLPFGVDFAARRWFFFDRRLGIARFSAQSGRSRWRDTQTVRLDYASSRLPRPLRNILYDEVKPLSPSLCLGIGGINAPRGRGDHFFFALASAVDLYPFGQARVLRRNPVHSERGPVEGVGSFSWISGYPAK